MKKEPLGFLYSKKMPNLDVFWSWKQATNSRYAWKNVIYRKMVPSFTIFFNSSHFFFFQKNSNQGLEMELDDLNAKNKALILELEKIKSELWKNLKEMQI